jgi:hypothetical protein
MSNFDEDGFFKGSSRKGKRLRKMRKHFDAPEKDNNKIREERRSKEKNQP